MDQSDFDELQRTFSANGPAEAIDRLCSRLRERKEYHNLFYALLLKKRHELGVSPLPTGPAQELPPETHAAYEDAIRAAGREVGRLFLEQGDIAQAWAYFRMLGESEPVAQALQRHQPAEGDDVQPLVQIAFYEGVLPRQGFDWILQRFGICNAITTLSSQDLPFPVEVKQYCIGRLVRALHQELCDRLAGEVERHEGKAPEVRPGAGALRRLMTGRDWLFQDEYYHIDVSHLSSVVQMSIHLTPGEELEMARELCAYGERLSPRFHYPPDPPFEENYKAYGVYLAILAGDRREEGLAYFRRKAEEADPETVGTYPAQVLVNLLLRLDRPREALEVARRHLAGVDNRMISCPSIAELCQRAGDYRTLAEVAREQGDAVHFVAGMIAENQQSQVKKSEVRSQKSE